MTQTCSGLVATDVVDIIVDVSDIGGCTIEVWADDNTLSGTVTVDNI